MANKYDKILDEYRENDLEGKGLKLDQTTPETVVNGAPTFDQGIIIKAGAKLVFDG